jgi:EAL domain-containing protein (putative c-di-GMP-specific phosphodiesterase class I)
VLEAAGAQAAQWASSAHDPPTTWVNLSAQQRADPQLVETVESVGAGLRRGSANARFGIKITEGALMSEPGIAIATARNLRDLDVRLAVKDFGAGYSSLGCVKLFPVDTVQIDRSVVRGVAHDRSDTAIIAAIAGFAAALGLEVIADGVETAEQAVALTELGCDIAQGPYVGPPVPAGAANLLLERS